MKNNIVYTKLENITLKQRTLKKQQKSNIFIKKNSKKHKSNIGS